MLRGDRRFFLIEGDSGSLCIGVVRGADRQTARPQASAWLDDPEGEGMDRRMDK